MRIGLATGVTCPSVRYHPAIIAQAAATLAVISDGRFTLGVGAGERLNEHVTGLGFPARQARHERLREALEIIRLLRQGGYRSYDGRYLKLEDARVFDLPAELPVIAVAASGPASAKIAAELGDGLFAVEPDADLVGTWHGLGGHGSGAAPGYRAAVRRRGLRPPRRHERGPRSGRLHGLLRQGTHRPAARAHPGNRMTIAAERATGRTVRKHAIDAVLGDLGRDSDFGDLATRGRAESVLKLLTVPAKPRTRSSKGS